MNYTAGEWKVSESGTMILTEIAGRKVYIADCKIDLQLLPSEVIANAHLIAAAPALYEALKAIMATATDARAYEMINRYRYVLAKAEGK